MNVLVIVILYHIIMLQSIRFNVLDTYWIIYACIILLLLSKGTKGFVILVLIILKLKLYVFLYAIFGVIISTFNNKFKTYRIISISLYENYLNLKINREKIPSKPTIFVVNYVSNYIEYMVHGVICDKLCLVLKEKGADCIKYIYGDNCVIPCGKNTYKSVERKVKYKMKKGYNIFAYVERDSGKRKDEYELGMLRSGMFNIAKNLGVTITPLCVDHIRHKYGVIDSKNFHVKVGETFHVDNVEEAMDNVKKFFEYELKQMKQN